MNKKKLINRKLKSFHWKGETKPQCSVTKIHKTLVFCS